MAKEKINHHIVLMSYTHFPSLFYYRHRINLLNNPDQVHAAPVHFYDEINKKVLDDHFDNVFMKWDSDGKKLFSKAIDIAIQEAGATVWHGFKYQKINEWLRDAGASAKMRDETNGKIKKITTYEQWKDFCESRNIDEISIFHKIDCLIGD